MRDIVNSLNRCDLDSVMRRSFANENVRVREEQKEIDAWSKCPRRGMGRNEVINVCLDLDAGRSESMNQ